MITQDKIADACQKAYLKLGHNAYFGNGFNEGVKFAESVLKKVKLKDLSEITDEELYEISIIEGWKSLWEDDRGQQEVSREELIQRGNDIVTKQIGNNWINFERVNIYLKSKGYVLLNAY
jgi:hypothetical protein